jgi:hypothetical protein
MKTISFSSRKNEQLVIPLSHIVSIFEEQSMPNLETTTGKFISLTATCICLSNHQLFRLLSQEPNLVSEIKFVLNNPDYRRLQVFDVEVIEVKDL